MPGADGARGKHPTDVTKSLTKLGPTRWLFSCVSSRRPRRPYVGYPNQFSRKKVSVGRPHHQVCPNTICCFAQHKAPARGSRNAQDSSATSLAALCSTTAATGLLFGRWAVLPGLGMSQTTHGRYDSEHARAMPAPVCTPTLPVGSVASKCGTTGHKRTSWVHIWVPNHDSTPTRYCGWRDDRYEPPPMHNCGRGRGLPQLQECGDGGRRVAGRSSPS